MKPVEFRGNALDVLRAFANSPRRECGFQIDRVQRGLDPADWKPLNTERYKALVKELKK